MQQIWSGKLELWSVQKQANNLFRLTFVGFNESAKFEFTVSQEDTKKFELGETLKVVIEDEEAS